MSLLVSTPVRPVHDASDLFTASRPRTVRPGWTTPREAFQSLLTGEAILVDIRTTAEQSAGTVPSRLGALRADPDQFAGLDAGSLVIVLAGDDDRAARTAALLRARGLTATALSGGLAAWRSAGMPVV